MQEIVLTGEVELAKAELANINALARGNVDDAARAEAKTPVRLTELRRGQRRGWRRQAVKRGRVRAGHLGGGRVGHAALARLAALVRAHWRDRGLPGGEARSVRTS